MRSRTRAARLVVPAVAVALLVSGCTARRLVDVREGTSSEASLVRAALTPLLAVLNDAATHRPECPIGLGIRSSPRINASIGRSKNPDCPTFALVVTTGALRRLPEPMLRALLAHELGHLALRHTGDHSKANETAADTFAVILLNRLEPRYPDACLQLVYVLSVLPEQAGVAWLASHPSPDRRAETVLDGCNR